MWRAPEGPEGQGGLRDRPLRAKLACGDLAGGRTRRRPQHQRHHKQTRGSPTGAKDQAGVLAGGGKAWPGFETTRPATDQPPCATVVEGAGGSGGHGRASRSTAPSEARVRRSRGRPDPTAPATPTSPQATRTGRPPPTSTHSGRARRRPQPSGTTSNTRRKAAAHRHTQRFGPQNKTRDSPSGPPRVHATSSYSTPSRGRVFSAVAQPRPRRPGPR